MQMQMGHGVERLSGAWGVTEAARAASGAPLLLLLTQITLAQGRQQAQAKQCRNHPLVLMDFLAGVNGIWVSSEHRAADYTC